MSEKTRASAEEPTTNPFVLSRRAFLGAAGAAGATAAAISVVPGLGGVAAASTRGAVHPNATGSGPYYWISHGAPGDQIWVIALKGAKQAASDLHVTVRTSMFNNDIPSQEEAITAAIVANAAGIATTSPAPNTLPKLVQKARNAGIPVVTFNADDTTADRIAFVGADLTAVGTTWAQYLVDNKLVKAGDSVFLPVEVAGASYQVLETTGINKVFQPLGIKAEVFQAGADPAASTAAMQSYLTAHPNTSAMIGLGDQVTSNTPTVFKALGWAPGKIPVVGWGNTSDTAQGVKQGYINAAGWQYPDSQGYQPIVLLKMVNDGLGAGYNVQTFLLYDKATVAQYMQFLQ